MSVTVIAHQKYLRTASRKLRLVAAGLNGLKVDTALKQLKFTHKRAAGEIQKTLIQAQKNAVNNSQLNPESLILTNIRVDAGPTYKRWQPVSRGRAHPIMKRTSHLIISVRGETQTPKPQPAKSAKSTKTAKPSKTTKKKETVKI